MNLAKHLSCVVGDYGTKQKIPNPQKMWFFFLPEIA